jgi:hypothetical protein
MTPDQHPLPTFPAVAKSFPFPTFPAGMTGRELRKPLMRLGFSFPFPTLPKRSGTRISQLNQYRTKFPGFLSIERETLETSLHLAVQAYRGRRDGNVTTSRVLLVRRIRRRQHGNVVLDRGHDAVLRQRAFIIAELARVARHIDEVLGRALPRRSVWPIA